MKKRTVAIGIRDFEKIRVNDHFYIDKTHFIKEWWDSGDDVTLITRPRRFGKTLLINTVDRFLSNQYENQAGYFEGLSIWEDEEYRKLQGSLPVIYISFADVKQKTYTETLKKIARKLSRLYDSFRFLKESGQLSEEQKNTFEGTTRMLSQQGLLKYSMEDITLAVEMSLQNLSEYLEAYYHRKVVILMDEYDTPMQEAYVSGYWDEIVELLRPFFDATFKTNPSLQRALMTGITRVSRESIFSDLNNLKIVTTTSRKYQDALGFTEEEVFAALDEYGYDDRAKAGVKYWYDGFTFGTTTDIYNPWSIINFLQEGSLTTYWANTSSNSLVGTLIREGDAYLKQSFEELLRGETILTAVDEQIVYGEMQDNPDAIWSLLLASGYLKVVTVSGDNYELALTNFEVQKMFRGMVTSWFGGARGNYNRFSRALIIGDVEAMNEYLNKVSVSVFSSFDTGNHPSGSEPERFYHGVVLGLIVELEDRYILTSNRESGFGRYDVLLEPRDATKDDGIIIEFKVFHPSKERALEDTVDAALAQIEEKNYAQRLVDLGVPQGHIRKYGFAFEGKNVLIGEAARS